MDVLWIKQQIEEKGISQAALADSIGLTAVQLNKVLSGYRVLQAKEADAIRRFFGYRLPEDPPRNIAVVGKVGAGAIVPLVDDYEKGAGLYHVIAPDILPSGPLVAVEIEGNSMSPVYEGGDILFYRRDFVGVPEDAVGHNCIVCDEEGNVWCKRLKVGSSRGLFNLISINPQADNQIDVKVSWASRIIFHLPKNLSQTTE